jgi:UPF0716 protein FxsA
MRLVPLALLLLPIAELLLLIEVGSHIGGLATLGLLALGVMAGMAILRGRGLASLAGARERFAHGDQPGQEMIDRLLLLLGGLLLLIPGFLTDALALALLLPWPRHALARRMLRNGLQGFAAGPGAGFTVFRASGRSQTRTWEGGEIVEGEVLREADNDSRLQGPPGSGK